MVKLKRGGIAVAKAVIFIAEGFNPTAKKMAEAAFQLWNEAGRPNWAFIATGNKAQDEEYKTSRLLNASFERGEADVYREADLFLDELARLGVPIKLLFREPWSGNTREQAVFVKKLLAEIIEEGDVDDLKIAVVYPVSHVRVRATMDSEQFRVDEWIVTRYCWNWSALNPFVGDFWPFWFRLPLPLFWAAELAWIPVDLIRGRLRFKSLPKIWQHFFPPRQSEKN